MWKLSLKLRFYVTCMYLLMMTVLIKFCLFIRFCIYIGFLAFLRLLKEFFIHDTVVFGFYLNGKFFFLDWLILFNFTLLSNFRCFFILLSLVYKILIINFRTYLLKWFNWFDLFLYFWWRNLFNWFDLFIILFRNRRF